MDYAKLWFVLWAVLWTAYFALDGFDLGVGFSGWLAASGDEERAAVFSSVGPFWDGNEVWLITAGGATFAAFPAVYASLFSWLYPALFLLLFSLIFRGVALEFRGKLQDGAWRTFWARTAAVSSFAATLLLGVAFGNLFRGLPIGAAGYEGTFLGLLNPYALVSGLLFCALFLYHGQLWIACKVPGAPSQRAAGIAAKAWYSLAALFVPFLFYSWAATGLSANFLARKYLLLLPLLAVAGLAVSRIRLAQGNYGCAFRASFAAIAFFTLTGFAGMYPDLLPSRLEPALGLSVYNSSSSPYTLKLMTWVVALFLPVVIAYQVWVHWLFREPLSAAELKKSGMY
ncbi:MAG: cytochrome d ubiquinol oxidase subunit II [Elusimicrobia bacterium]|nr:cytochrome d ubiquinol oxidase subunit II [Elusimicrobiota bacterium]